MGGWGARGREIPRDAATKHRAPVAILSYLCVIKPLPPTGNSPPPAPGLAGDLYGLVTHLHKNCTGDLLEALGLLDLNLSQSKLMHRLEVAGHELSLGQVAESVGISLPTASRTVEDLVRRGLASATRTPATAG